MSPPTSPIAPYLVVKNAKIKREKSDFTLSNDKTLLQSCSNQQLTEAKLFV